MRFSVKNRLKLILEDVTRMQELAGLSDPEQGYVAPINAYEDNYEGLIKRFGKEIINKIILFVKTRLNTSVVLEKIEGEDLKIKILDSADFKIDEYGDNNFIIRFGGYMHDSKKYSFNIAHKDNLGEYVFDFRFSMDIEGNLNDWESMKK